MLVLAMLLAGCVGRSTSADDGLGTGDTVAMKYASLLKMVRYDSCTVVTIDNPWKEGAVLHRYVLVERGAPLPHSLPSGTVVRTPVEKAVVFTSAHCQLIEWLGATEQLAGVADLKYILVNYVKEGVRQGRIADCGDGMAPLIEKIIQIKPDALWISPFENSGGYGRLENINIPIVECADYMECSAMARAEWMRFYGLLLGKSREADSLFAVLDSSYLALKRLAASGTAQTSGTERTSGTAQASGAEWTSGTAQTSGAERTSGAAQASGAERTSGEGRRSMITEKLTGGTWYVPGGASSVGQLIADANGDYAWSDDKHGGSLAMTFETVLAKAGGSDVWIFNYFGSGELTYERLASEYQGYRQMKAFKERNVWYVDTQRVPYFEEVSFRPDYLLRDYIILLHPELGIGATRYYRRVK